MDSDDISQMIESSRRRNRVVHRSEEILESDVTSSHTYDVEVAGSKYTVQSVVVTETKVYTTIRKEA